MCSAFALQQNLSIVTRAASRKAKQKSQERKTLQETSSAATRTASRKAKQKSQETEESPVLRIKTGDIFEIHNDHHVIPDVGWVKILIVNVERNAKFLVVGIPLKVTTLIDRTILLLSNRSELLLSLSLGLKLYLIR